MQRLRCWWFDGGNAGDMVTPALLQCWGYEAVHCLDGPRILGCGSILSFARNGDAVLGSGYLDPAPESWPTPEPGLEIVACRGQRTAEIVGGAPVLGDLGLLLPSAMGVRHKPQHGLIGVVPHYTDIGRPLPKNCVELSPVMPVRHLVRAISRCEYVLASSLHGLVFADAMGVPRTRVHWPETMDNVYAYDMKYEDYMTGIKQRPRPSTPIMDAGAPDPVQKPDLTCLRQHVKAWLASASTLRYYGA